MFYATRENKKLKKNNLENVCLSVLFDEVNLCNDWTNIVKTFTSR